MSDDRPPVGGGWFREEPDVPPQRAPGYSPDDMPTQVGGMPAVQSGRGGGYPAPQGQGAGQNQGPDYQATQYGGGYGDDYGNGYGAPAAPVQPQPQAQQQPPFPEAYGRDFRGEPTQFQPQYQPYQPSYADGDQAAGSRYPDYEPGSQEKRAEGRNRTPLIAGTAVVGVAALGLVGYLMLGGSSPKSGSTTAGGSNGKGTSAAPSPTHTSFQPTSSDPATAAEQTGSAFLTAWQSGNLDQAAKYTDDPTAALAAMNDYKSGLNLSSLKLTPQPAVAAGSSPTVSAGPSAGSSSSSADASASGAAAGSSPSGTVPFAATATVSLATKGATPLPWTYNSSLVAYKQSDGWSVKWSPAILAPNLTDGQKLKVVSVPAGVGKITDANGSKLSGYSETALSNISSALSSKAPSGHGTAGVAIERVTSSGDAVSDSKATLKKPVDDSSLKTTIDPAAEAAARSAVAMHPRSSMVVLRPSTGAILAVANSSGSGDTALTGGLAPGSTFKIITSTALFNYGVVQLYSPVACPLTFTVQGVVYHNSTDSQGKNEESLPAGTPFATDFAQSCNNAFTQFYKQLEGGKLAHTASTYFGLDQSWDIGLGPNTYFGIPNDSSGAELAQENFGQGKIVASPLAMASVAATVGTGSFHQPYLVDGLDKVSATALPSGTDSNLKTMMRMVVTSGTAAGVFHGVGTVYAKTGTADADANKDGKPNGWMVVYDPSKDLAIGCVVVDSGFGATFAGPEVEHVLSTL